MMTDAVVNFLLVFDHAASTLVRSERFNDPSQAAAAYSAAEAEFSGNDDMEIVLIGADSIETIRSTHGHYFNGERPAVSRYLELSYGA